jgi:DhnA family fructose-bisphosphate aldolase class Ia
MRDDQLQALIDARVHRPQAVAEAAANRRKPQSLLGDHGRIMMIACDHPARGALGAGTDPLAMADRVDLLNRIVLALSRPGVNGMLGTADILEDLLLLGALDDKVVVGSMNRGGLQRASFEIDDRFTGYDAASIAEAGYEGGKMLLRFDYEDPATADTMQACADAVSDLADHQLMAMVEPFLSHRVDGRVKNELTPEAMIKVISISSGLGTTSAYTWLKLPVVDDMERVMAASTMPALILGGEVSADADAAYAQWQKALALPTVQGLVVGRSLLYPPDGDVAKAVDTAVGLL